MIEIYTDRSCWPVPSDQGGTVLVRRFTINAALFVLFCIGVMLAWVWRWT
jgi:ribonuclease HI